ncbi:MAG: DUF3352 domain-containing protein [Bacteroidota bacterium]
MRTFIRILLLVVLVAAAAIGGYFFLETNATERNPFDFVPEDFVYVVESDRPVGDWQDLSKTEIWQFLKGNEYFADITASADYLDSLLKANQTLVDFIKLGDLMISAHMISTQEYDFVIMVDLKGKGRKLPKLKPVMVPLFESLGYQVQTDNYFNIELYDLYDPVYKETLTMAAVDNVLITSYTRDLVKKAIDQTEKSSVLTNEEFAKVRDKADPGELYSIYLNYNTFERLVGAFTSEPPEMLGGLGEVVSFSGFDLSMKDDEVRMEGYTKQLDSVASYLSVFKDVGQGRVLAPTVLPIQTATFTSLGFDDFSDVFSRFTSQMQTADPEGYADLEKNQQRIEKALKIEFERDFFAWMSDEIVTAVVPVTPQKYAFYALLHFDDYEETKERLDYVTKRIGKTPVKFEEIDYQGFPIKYLKLRGFFSLFFKKMFNKIERPHFTYIDDYVVFSNDTTSLQFMIDQYLAQQTLQKNEAFADFLDRFDNKSNVYTYINNVQMYPYLRNTLDAEARRDLQKNQDYLLAFPQVGFQLSPGSGMYRAHLYGEFKKPTDIKMQ